MGRMTDVIDPTHCFPWHVLGTGAIGGLFACKLQSAGLQIAAIPSQRPDTEPTALTLTLEENSHAVRYSLPLDQQQPIHQLLLTTKAHQTASAMRCIEHRLMPRAIIVVLQNGLGTQDWLNHRWPDLQIVAGTTTEGANRPDGKYFIRHAARGTTCLGPWRDQDQDACEHVMKQWKSLELNLEYDANIRQRLWEKLVMNCAINPLTALLGCRNGALLEQVETVEIMRKIVNEVAELMRERNLAVDANALFGKVQRAAHSTDTNISSMLQDHRARRCTEIDFINGFVVREATALRLSCPINARLTALVEQQRNFTVAQLVSELSI